MKIQGKGPQGTKKIGLGEMRFLLYIVLGYLLIVNSIGLTKIVGTSMEPTLRDGSLVLVNKFLPNVKQPKYGDVIIIRQETKGYNVTKRVIGLPGDSVEIQEGTVYVNDSPLPEIYTLGKPDDMAKVKVGERKLFVLGDSRTPGESLDSRSEEVGLIKIEEVRGHTIVSLCPYYRIMKPLKL